MKTVCVEVCPHCLSECVYEDCDPEVTSYVKYCTHCGAEIMLCNECLHADDNQNRKCDWHGVEMDGRFIGSCFRGVTRNEII